MKLKYIVDTSYMLEHTQDGGYLHGYLRDVHSIIRSKGRYEIGAVYLLLTKNSWVLRVNTK
jgi:hypothetical protein